MPFVLAVLGLCTGLLGALLIAARDLRVLAGTVVVAGIGAALTVGIPPTVPRIVAALALLVLLSAAVLRSVARRLGQRAPALFAGLAVVALGSSAQGSLGWAALVGGFAVGTALGVLRLPAPSRPVVALVLAALAIPLLTGGLDAAPPGRPTPQRAAPHPVPEPPQPAELSGLADESNAALSRCDSGAARLQDCGRAPRLASVPWLNTDGRRVRLSELRGEVVLLDFWTYSCVNCRRSVRHLADWDARYRAAGLRVLGVHSAKFGFEKQRSNVAAQVRRLGLRYPVALDAEKTVWNDYRNRFWPTSFLIDSRGRVRHLQIGEGGYSATESQIRDLLRDARPGVRLPERSDLPNDAPKDRSASGDNHLDYFSVRNYRGTELVQDRPTRYRVARELPAGTVSIGGTWTVTDEHFAAGENAKLALGYRARTVYLVLGGRGHVDTTVDSGPTVRTEVSGEPRLYPIVQDDRVHSGGLSVRASPGVLAYEVVTE